MSNLKYRLLAIVLLSLAATWALFPRNKTVRQRAADGTMRDTVQRHVPIRLGLDLQGGMHLELEVDESKQAVANKSEAIDRALKTVRNRIEGFGVSEPVVQTQGADRVVVELPGVANAKAIQDLVGQTGRLDFVPLPADKYGTYPNQGPQVAAEGQRLPTDEKPLFSGDQIESSNPTTDQTGNRAVGFVLKQQGAKLFSDYTTNNVNHYFAIVLDGRVVSAPRIESPITSGQGIITGGAIGGFAAKEMNNLVTILRYGSLPFPVAEVSSEVTSATLGPDFLRQTIFAAAIGILLVFLFMMIYYRLPGIIASGALIYYTIVVLAVFRLIPVTLTLAGIAGFVLSVGMAVDANILIFERTKEELRLGKSLPAVIEAGFSRAWNSILDSNVSSLITAGILYWFGSSTIRGFALVLIIGVLVSMFTAITVSRTMLRLVVREDWARKAKYFGVTEEEFLSRPIGRGVRGGEARSRV